MKKFDIKLGGHHFVGDDLLYIQSALAEAIVALAGGSGYSLIAISGVEITFTGTINWTAGWLLINGELCQVDAGSAAYPANNTFVISETSDAAGNQTYEDLNVEDTYLIRKAKIQGNAGGTNLYSNIKRLNPSACTTWDSLSAIVGFTWAPGTYSPIYRINQISQVEFGGSVERASYDNTLHAPMVTLPVGHRPDRTIAIGVPGTINSIAGTIILEINTGGDVTAIDITNGDDLVLYMDGIHFSIK